MKSVFHPPFTLRFWRVIALSGADAEFGPTRDFDGDPAELPVRALIGRVIAEQVLRLQLRRDLLEYGPKVFELFGQEGVAAGGIRHGHHIRLAAHADVV